MADLTSLMFFRTAPATSTSQWEVDTAATYVFQEPNGVPTANFNVRKLERDLVRGDNEDSTRVVGPQVLPTGSLQTLARGLNNNTGGAVTAAKLTDNDPLLVACLGTAGNGGTGSTIAASTTGTVVVADASAIGVADVIAFQDDAHASDEIIVRQVDGKSSNTLTTDRAWSGDEVSSGIVYVGMTYAIVQATHKHTPFHVDVEGENWRRKAYGCLPDLKMNFPDDGGLVTMDWSWAGCVWADVAEANPTYTAPTVGTGIPNIDASLWIGDTEYQARGISFSVTQKRVPLTSDSGVNGLVGYDVQKKVVSLEFTLYRGTSAPELSDSALATLQGIAAQDVALQVGRTAGAILYIRIPAGDFDAEPTTVDGMDAVKCMVKPTRSAEASSTACAYLAFI